MKKLTHALLLDLLSQGYGVLESDRPLPDPDAVLTPKIVTDWDEYIYVLDEDVVKEYIIEEALQYPEQDLTGNVVKVNQPS